MARYVIACPVAGCKETFARKPTLKEHLIREHKLHALAQHVSSTSSTPEVSTTSTDPPVPSEPFDDSQRPMGLSLTQFEEPEWEDDFEEFQEDGYAKKELGKEETSWVDYPVPGDGGESDFSDLLGL